MLEAESEKGRLEDEKSRLEKEKEYLVKRLEAKSKENADIKDAFCKKELEAQLTAGALQEELERALNVVTEREKELADVNVQLQQQKEEAFNEAMKQLDEIVELRASNTALEDQLQKLHQDYITAKEEGKKDAKEEYNALVEQIQQKDQLLQDVVAEHKKTLARMVEDKKQEIETAKQQYKEGLRTQKAEAFQDAKLQYEEALKETIAEKEKAYTAVLQKLCAHVLQPDVQDPLMGDENEQVAAILEAIKQKEQHAITEKKGLEAQLDKLHQYHIAKSEELDKIVKDKNNEIARLKDQFERQQQNQEDDSVHVCIVKVSMVYLCMHHIHHTCTCYSYMCIDYKCYVIHYMYMAFRYIYCMYVHTTLRGIE